jgi:hypothetical protein
MVSRGPGDRVDTPTDCPEPERWVGRAMVGKKRMRLWPCWGHVEGLGHLRRSVGEAGDFDGPGVLSGPGSRQSIGTQSGRAGIRWWRRPLAARWAWKPPATYSGPLSVSTALTLTP